MANLPGISSEPFGSLTPPALLGWILGAKDFDVPHPVSGLRRKIAKRFLRWTSTSFDATYRGLKLRLLPYDNAGDLEIAMHGRHSEEDELEVFVKEAPKAMSLVDIGANIGIYSMTAAQVMPKGARILAFEPAPGTRARFAQNLSLNGFLDRVEVVPAGVGSQNGELVLARGKSHNAGSATLANAQAGTGGETVKVVRLIDVLQERGIESIDILKIDIEGFEDQALVPFFEEAPDTVWPKYVMLETCHANQWDLDLIQVLSERDYVVTFENARNRHYRRGQTNE